METSLSQNRKWQLSQGAFDLFLSRLDHDKEHAGYEYNKLKSDLSNFCKSTLNSLGIRAGSSNSEEYAEEAINRVCKKLQESEQKKVEWEKSRIENVRHYIYGVARLVCMEGLRRPPLEELPDVIPEPSRDPLSDDPDATRGCYIKCLKEQAVQDRLLVTVYFTREGGEKIELHKLMAEMLEVSKDNLKQKVCRIRKKLNVCVEKCLVESVSQNDRMVTK